MTPAWRVLFLCTGNSCRSQMAEGWARACGRIEAFSAGVAPGVVDPLAVRVMAECDVDISEQRSKSVDEMVGLDFDCVVTVCDNARERCPVFPGGARRLHAAFDDPPALAAGARTEQGKLDHYRRVRDEIRAFVEELPDVLRDS